MRSASRGPGQTCSTNDLNRDRGSENRAFWRNQRGRCRIRTDGYVGWCAQELAWLAALAPEASEATRHSGDHPLAARRQAMGVLPFKPGRQLGPGHRSAVRRIPGGKSLRTNRMMDRLIDSFLYERRAARGASEHTLRAYGADLRQLACYLSDREISELAQVDIRVLRGWLATFAGCTRTTVARKMATLRSFFRWAHRNGHVSADCAKALATPRRPRPLPKF